MRKGNINKSLIAKYVQNGSINHLFLIVILFLLFSIQNSFSNEKQSSDSLINDHIKLYATLSDSAFDKSGEISVEVLENGEKATVNYQEEFNIKLPLDTIWGICFTQSSLEKCYEVKYLGSDYSFSHVITGDSLQVKYVENSNPQLEIDSVKAVDSLDALSEDEEYLALLNTSKAKTQLNKIVMQFRRRPKRELGKSVVSTKRMKRMPTLAEADVIRTLQALPGVVASSDFSTKIYVRGGGSDQNLFLLDNAVVYSPVHFFGLFSTFLVEGIDDLNFYKGGFAPEFGNRLSSVVDIKSRDGAKDDEQAKASNSNNGSDLASSADTNEPSVLRELFFKNSLKISTFATQAHTEGKIGDLSWLIAGRTTYIKQMLDLMNKVNITDFTLDYFFYDLQGNVAYDFGDGHKLRFSWYAGKDDLNFDPLVVDWGNRVFPLNWEYKINKNWQTRATFAYSFFTQKFGIEDLFTMSNEMVTYSYKHNFEYIGFNNHIIDFGLDLSRNEIQFSQDIGALTTASTADQQNFWLASIYAQDKWRLSDFIFTYGFRANYQNLIDEFAVEPRLSLTYEFDKNSRFDIHLGYYLQYINSIIMMDMENLNEFYYPATKTTNSKLPPSNSKLLSLGYSNDKLFEMFNFTIEGYYKTLENMLILAQEEMYAKYDNLKPGFYGDVSKLGEGYSLGYEISLRKDEGIINAGINWSQGYSAFVEQWDSLSYYPNWHQAYALKADLGLTIRGNKKDGAMFQHKRKGRYLRASAMMKLASGMPYTEYVGYAYTHELDDPFPESNTLQGSRNASVYPTYFRFDVKPIDVGREGRWNFSWSILNITNHYNIFTLFYDTNVSPPKENKVSQFPFFPVLLNYEIYF